MGQSRACLHTRALFNRPVVVDRLTYAHTETDRSVYFPSYLGRRFAEKLRLCTRARCISAGVSRGSLAEKFEDKVLA